MIGYSFTITKEDEFFGTFDHVAYRRLQIERKASEKILELMASGRTFAFSMRWSIEAEDFSTNRHFLTISAVPVEIDLMRHVAMSEQAPHNTVPRMQASCVPSALRRLGKFFGDAWRATANPPVVLPSQNGQVAP